MMTKYPRVMTAVLGTCLSTALVASAVAGEANGKSAKAEKAAATMLQSSNLIDLATGASTTGGGVLVRSRSELDARLSMTGLEPNSAYTIWWMVFNRPWNCSNNVCGDDDLGLPTGVPNEAGIEATGAAVFNATGFVTDGTGSANVTARLNDGPLPLGTGYVPVPSLEGTLWEGNGLRAEVHMILRAHGPAIPGQVGRQISDVEATCGICADKQRIVFRAVQPRN